MSLNLAVQICDLELVQFLLEENQRENIPNTLPSHVIKGINLNSRQTRKTSRQIAMSNLGLTALVDQKNERGLGPLHIAAAEGNMYV